MSDNNEAAENGEAATENDKAGKALNSTNALIYLAALAVALYFGWTFGKDFFG